MGYYCPMPIRDEPAPPVVKGARFMDRDATARGRQRFRAWATVYMQDVYNGLEPHVKRGEIKQIAVVQEIEKSTHTPQNNQRLDGRACGTSPCSGSSFRWFPAVPPMRRRRSGASPT
jgi:hypothetical protein